MTKNMLNLKGKIVSNGLTQDYVAKKAGINRSTFYRKMLSGGRDFTAGEIKIMQEILELTNEQVCAIFLN